MTNINSEKTKLRLVVTLIIISSLLLLTSILFLRMEKWRSPEFSLTEEIFNQTILDKTAYKVKTVLSNAYIQVLDLQEEGSGETLQINLRPDEPYTSYERCTFVIHTEGELKGWSLNIGASITNDGWGGDSATNYLDSELVILNNTLEVYCNDFFESVRLVKETGQYWGRDKLLKDGQSAMISILNNQIIFTPEGDSPLTISHPGIFCLNDQLDPNGSGMNNTIFAGINRVIHPGRNDRTGQGITDAEIVMNKFYIPDINTYIVERYKEAFNLIFLSILKIPAGRAPENNTWYKIWNKDHSDFIWLSVAPESLLDAKLTESEYLYTLQSLFKKSYILKKAD